MNQDQLQKTFVKIAIEWVKNRTRYVHRGTSKLGCDCTGLIIGICREMGYLGKYELRQYPSDWNLHAGADNYIEEELLKVADTIPNSEVIESDILVFRFGKCLAHVGILINKKNGVFAHCLCTAKLCKFDIVKSSMWSKRWEKSFRLNPEKMKRFI
jgi:hypothetical protein